MVSKLETNPFISIMFWTVFILSVFDKYIGSSSPSSLSQRLLVCEFLEKKFFLCLA